MEIRLSTIDDTNKLALLLAQTLRGGEVIGLSGALGAGKTTFTRKLSKALGTVEPVSSPTYVLQHLYGGNKFQIEHWDLFRVADLPEELYEPVGPNNIRIVEWADRFQEFWELLDLALDFHYLYDTDKAELSEMRLVKIKAHKEFEDSVLRSWD